MKGVFNDAYLCNMYEVLELLGETVRVWVCVFMGLCVRQWRGLKAPVGRHSFRFPDFSRFASHKMVWLKTYDHVWSITPFIDIINLACTCIRMYSA